MKTNNIKNILLAGSCTLATNPKLGDYLSFVSCNISSFVIPLIFALALAYFVWGVVQYVIGANDERERTIGRQHMIWGVIALAVMIGVWGLVHVVTQTFGIQATGAAFIPQANQ